MASALYIPVKRRMDRESTEQQIHHLNAWDPDYLDLPPSIRKDNTSGPSKYRRAISLLTLETSLSFPTERKALQSPRASGELAFGDPNAIGGDNVGAEN